MTVKVEAVIHKIFIHSCFNSHYSYQLFDLTGENKILMDMNVSICLETNSTCNMSVKVLDGTKLPKQPCNWTRGFAAKGMM